MILLSLSNSKSPPFVVNGIWNFGLLQYRGATICPKTSRAQKTQTVCIVCSFSRLDLFIHCSTRFWRAVLSIFFLNAPLKRYRIISGAKSVLRTTRSAHRSCASLILFTGCLLIETIVQVTVRWYESMRKPNGAPHRPLLDLDVWHWHSKTENQSSKISQSQHYALPTWMRGGLTLRKTKH